ncbi:hypothetical protein ACJX0J_007013 [Zea mays]
MCQFLVHMIVVVLIEHLLSALFNIKPCFIVIITFAGLHFHDGYSNINLMLLMNVCFVLYIINGHRNSKTTFLKFFTHVFQTIFTLRFTAESGALSRMIALDNFISTLAWIDVSVIIRRIDKPLQINWMIWTRGLLIWI